MASPNQLSVESARVRVGERWVGAGAPVFVIAEIGINHNGSVEIAKRLIDGAVLAGGDAVKFQKRTPEKCVPRDQWNIERDTPWGRMTYIDYRHRVEFGEDEYAEIDRYCKRARHRWFASLLGRASRSTSSSGSSRPATRRLGLAHRRRAAPRDEAPPAAR